MLPKLTQAFEWVLTPMRGEDAILTENQYEFYKAQVKNGDYSKIFFDEFEINPNQIASAFKRPATYIKEKYPCRECHTNGYLFVKDDKGVYFVCPNCKGTGVDLKK